MSDEGYDNDSNDGELDFLLPNSKVVKKGLLNIGVWNEDENENEDLEIGGFEMLGVSVSFRYNFKL